jgi:hypothetical protein|tara:strand:+ start:137 stop:349 length:213 start_codon:yes stop_codon:yes gene_type:complete
MYQILKKKYRNYYVIEEHESLLDAKDYMENIQLLLSHLKFKIKKSICTKTSEYFSIDSKPRTYFKMVEKL